MSSETTAGDIAEAPADRRYRDHLQHARVRAVASLAMWSLAFAACLIGIIQVKHLLEISGSIAFLDLIGFAVTAVVKRTTEERAYKALIIAICVTEALGYTAIIYFLGGIQATYLTPIYVAFISYVGFVEHRESPYLTAAVCAVCFNLMLALQHFGFLPEQSVILISVVEWRIQIVIGLAVSGFMFVAAYIAASGAVSLKRMRRQLAEHNLLLERRVEERTSELRAEVEERKLAEQKASASLKEKDILLKEIHHRVKNNLQVVSSLLSLQSSNITNAETVEVLNESRNRVRSMALVHEKLYQSKGLDRVDFAEYLRTLTADLGRSYGVSAERIGCSVTAGDISLDIDRAIPCGLIVSELVSNALKHAFPGDRKGAVTVDVHRAEEATSDGESIVLVIADNGTGLPKDMDFRSTKSLGLQLVNGLTRQLGGTIEVNAAAGTTFTIRIPKSKER